MTASLAHILLALDTSTPQCSLALGQLDGETSSLLATDATTAKGGRASQALSDRLEHLVAAGGVSPQSITAIACGAGPGMFTGVRVAVATAKGLGLGLGAPVVAVSTLAAVASSLPSSHETPQRLALLDARRGEVYAGLYDADGGAIDPVVDCCAPLARVLSNLEGSCAAVGPGATPYTDILATSSRIAQVHEIPGPTPEGLWRAAVHALRKNGPQAPNTLSATYMRKSYAELGIHKPRRPVHRSPFLDPA